VGKAPGSLKLFSKLRVAELKEELRRRGEYNLDCPKHELQDQLDTRLKGVQRVPSLLILNPEQALSDLNLEQYTVLDCEPLHDIKGHLANLFEELPYILADEVRKKCEALLETNLSGEKVTGLICIPQAYRYSCFLPMKVQAVN